MQKAYGDREILRGIDLTVNRGEVVVLMGPSGSGKSTLLRMINHLESLDWGEITVGGSHVGYERVPGGGFNRHATGPGPRRGRIGMVFQQFNLFAHLTALRTSSRRRCGSTASRRTGARHCAFGCCSSVGLADHARPPSAPDVRRPAAARGDRPRAGGSPRLMLFDEPTSALDPELVGEVLDVIRGSPRPA